MLRTPHSELTLNTGIDVRIPDKNVSNADTLNSSTYRVRQPGRKAHEINVLRIFQPADVAAESVLLSDEFTLPPSICFLSGEYNKKTFIT